MGVFAIQTNIDDEIARLEARLSSIEDDVKNRQHSLCTLRVADVQAPEERALEELIEARDFLKTKLERLRSCRHRLP